MPQTTSADLVLHYAPRTRSFGALWLLEELGVPYQLESFNLASGRHKQPDYLAIHPMGKVPAVVDRGVSVSEMGAIAIYLADRYPAARLAPSIEAPERAAYLRWIFFASAILEPALAEKFNKWEPRPTQHAWGSFDQMLSIATEGTRGAGWLVGDHFTAADLMVANGLRFAMMFGAIAKEGSIADYVARATARDAFVRASAIEAREGERFPMRVG